MCIALTGALDRAVASLVDPGDGPVAVVALGGYGRGEMSPHSDVDLMLLHDLGDAADIAADLFRPLWDAKLTVGHSVRTVREAAAAARERFDTQTTLLTSRLIAGSDELFDRLMADVARVTKARPLRRYLVEAERARRAETQYPLMAADLKTGRGGLRTLQGFEWERRREALIGRFSTDTRPEEEDALETLLQIRNGLHVVAGRRHDVYSPELREPVASWLGRETFASAGDLVEATQTIDRLAERKWPEVLDAVPGPVGRRVWSRRSTPAPALHTDRPPDLDELDRILVSGERGRAAFDRLAETGNLETILPEWGVVATLPQLEPFHVHPVAAHLWRTVAEMGAILDDGGHLGQVAGHLGRPRLLRLVAFLHDIGKGHGGDHAVVGAGIAAAVADRLELDPVDADLLAGGVRHHLLLPIAATRRDLDDPAVIADVVTQAGSIELLQVLYLLTVADSRATGPSMWNDWKATLVRTLFLRCAAQLDILAPGPGVGTTRDEVLALAGEDSAQAGTHLDLLPDVYLRSFSARQVLWHVDLVAKMSGESNLGVWEEGAIETVSVVGRSRAGFRQTVANVFAANGIDVLEARLLGRGDGLVVDSFRVRDDRTGLTVPVQRWDQVRIDLEAGLVGDLDTGSKLATRAASYPVPGL
ncbi:MAG TPA: HD domain-containing protein, partial [Acidimicrobiia bacterium]